MSTPEEFQIRRHASFLAFHQRLKDSQPASLLVRAHVGEGPRASQSRGVCAFDQIDLSPPSPTPVGTPRPAPEVTTAPNTSLRKGDHIHLEITSHTHAGQLYLINLGTSGNVIPLLPWLLQHPAESIEPGETSFTTDCSERTLTLTPHRENALNSLLQEKGPASPREQFILALVLAGEHELTLGMLNPEWETPVTRGSRSRGTRGFDFSNIKPRVQDLFALPRETWAWGWLPLRVSDSPPQT